MNTRLIAARVIAKLLKNSETLPTNLDKALVNVASAQDRAFVKAIVYGVCRFYHRLEFTLDALVDKPVKSLEVKALIMIGLYQLIFMRVKNHAAVSETVQAAKHLAWARGLINAVLRGYLRQSEALEQAAEAAKKSKYSHPEWMIRRIENDWPEQAETILLENNQPPPMVLRVNRQKIKVADYLQLLIKAGIPAHITPDCPEAIMLKKPTQVEVLPGFLEGSVSVQDGAAQLAADLLDVKPGQRLLDVCAAPGGKTCHLLELHPDIKELLAVDIDPNRLQRIIENLQRLNLKATLVEGDAATPEAWWDGILFDRILLDAPCSATGVIRRHPDIKLIRQEDDVDTIVALQGKILAATWPLLAPGGVLLYATCSILKQENECQISTFLAKHDDAEELPITAASWGIACKHGRQILTGDCSMDGFYYARIAKI